MLELVLSMYLTRTLVDTGYVFNKLSQSKNILVKITLEDG